MNIEIVGKFDLGVDLDELNNLIYQVAQEAESKVHAGTPLGKTSPHLADSYQLDKHPEDHSALISNTKTVRSKAGKQWQLLSLISTGTAPHDIPQAFGFPLPFGIGGRFNGKFHPGMPANDFIDQALDDIHFESFEWEKLVKV